MLKTNKMEQNYLKESKAKLLLAFSMLLAQHAFFSCQEIRGINSKGPTMATGMQIVCPQPCKYQVLLS